MNILIYGQVYKPNHRECLLEVLKALEKEGFAPYADEAYWAQTEPVVRDHKGVTIFKNFETNPIDVVMAFGGDGTVLGAISLVNEYQVPVMGINLGRLGYLSSIEGKVAGFAVSELAKGRYHYDERSMVRLETTADIFKNSKVALNDFTLHKRDTSSMIIIHTYIDGELLNSFWADGLIIATPTGSTGYSLSCGGPIVFPNSGSLVITPVAPHNLSVRPIVIPDTSVISFEIEGRADSFLCTLDSRFEAVTAEDKLTVRKAKVVTRFIQLYNYSFLRTLHDKLTWGKDSRN
ncbi:MAG: NAD kinase [Saprospiraceae bacterium]|nr:NAD kinase [Saprospiraceae bacterium]